MPYVIFCHKFAEFKRKYCEGWKAAYLKEVHIQVKAGKEVSVKQLPKIPKGQPLQELDQQVLEYLHSLCEAGGIVNTLIAIAELSEDMTAICLQ